MIRTVGSKITNLSTWAHLWIDRKQGGSRWSRLPKECSKNQTSYTGSSVSQFKVTDQLYTLRRNFQTQDSQMEQITAFKQLNLLSHSETCLLLIYFPFWETNMNYFLNKYFLYFFLVPGTFLSLGKITLKSLKGIPFCNTMWQSSSPLTCSSC